MPTLIKDLLEKALEENGYHFPPTVQKQFLLYLELLEKWNRVINLTSLETPKDLVYLHIIDSLAIYPYLHGTRMLDVGSGGGLPGIPLAIADPDKTWVLLDKSQKKTRFLVQLRAELGLKNITVVCARAEDYRPECGFDCIISRAFGTIKLFLECTKELINPNGCFLAMKGSYPNKELAELPATFTLSNVQKLELRGLRAERHLVSIRSR